MRPFSASEELDFWNSTRETNDLWKKEGVWIGERMVRSAEKKVYGNYYHHYQGNGSKHFQPDGKYDNFTFNPAAMGIGLDCSEWISYLHT
ncbi:hypothetical protein Lepil_0490 [Leptonema illini DSM 21528]|uniref:Uncharacterized protein n=1 Tax=Leptonema illini DSM 21528 TaxID=929563 RepID=H2CB54_9LEPT|nr:hypothetical protein Lepil_0490 [Leptonema illini DSM 21528]